MRRLIIRKIRKHLDLVSNLSTDHNKINSTIFSMRSIVITANNDNLIEVEVRSPHISGWIYDKSIDVVAYCRGEETHLVYADSLRLLIEGLAKKHGKLESETPKAYHVSKKDGFTHYFIHEDDFLQLEMIGA